MNISLATEGLSYRYSGDNVWEDVCFELKGGEIAFLVGINGSGKSTFLRCLAGWTVPKSGAITLNGERFVGSNREQRSRIAFVPDTPVFYDDLTAAEHIDFVLKANRKEKLSDKTQSLMEGFGLLGRMNQYPSSYSRGMREKLALVLALILSPDVILLDEAYGPLDQVAARILSRELKAAAERGALVIVSCHHQVAGLIPDKCFRFHDGRFDEAKIDSNELAHSQFPENQLHEQEE